MYLCRRLLISLRFTMKYCSFFYYSNWEAYLCPLIFSNKSIVMWMYMCVCKCMNVYVCMCVYMYMYVNVQEDMLGSVCNVCISCQYNINCPNNVYVAHYVFVLSCFVVFIICIYVCVALFFSLFLFTYQTYLVICYILTLSNVSMKIPQLDHYLSLLKFKVIRCGDYESDFKYMYLFFNLKYYPDILISETKYIVSPLII